MATRTRTNNWTDPTGLERDGELLDQRTTETPQGECVVSLIHYPERPGFKAEHCTIEIFVIATQRTHQQTVPSEAEGRRLMAKLS